MLLFGAGTAATCLLSSAPVIAETIPLVGNPQPEANLDFLASLLGGVLFVPVILSLVLLFPAVLAREDKTRAMVLPIVYALSALITAALNYLLLGLWGKVILTAVVSAGLLLVMELSYLIQFALSERLR